MLMFDHASIHTPCTAQPILQPKVKKTSVQEINYVITAYNRISRYISCASCYILRYTTLYFESGWNRLASPFFLGCTLVLRIADSTLPLCSLIDRQAPKAGLAAPKLPQPRIEFVDIAAPAKPNGKPASLPLLNM